MAARDPRRSRTLVLLALLLFFAGQLGVGLALDAAPLRVRFPEAARRIAELRRAERPADVLLLGSSRFQATFDFDVLNRRLERDHGAAAPHVRGLVFTAGDVVASRMLFEEMLAAGVRPRVAVVEVTPEWLVRPPRYLSAQLVRLFRWPDVAHWLPELMIEEWDKLSRVRLIPVYHFRREILSLLVGRPPPYLASPRPDGGAAAAAPPAAVDAEAVADAGPAVTSVATSAAGDAADSAKHAKGPASGANRWGRRVHPYRMSERAVRTLEELLARCREERIACVLAGPPVASAHRAIYGPDVASQYGGLLARLEREHGVRFYELADRAPDTEFFDSSHLHAEGRLRFSEEVAPSVVETIWKGAGPAAPQGDGDAR